MPLRLQGTALKCVRAIAESAIGGGIVWRQMAGDYGVTAIQHLPDTARAPLEAIPRPIHARPPRTWGEPSDAPPPSLRVTGRTIRAAYAAGTTTPSEVLVSIREHIQAAQYGDTAHSPFTDMNWDHAIQMAAESTKRWEKGCPLGPLDGVPVPVKDEHDMVGLVTRGGTSYLQDPAQKNSFCVEQLIQAGALVYAKTHATEWGMCPLGTNDNFPMPRNLYSSHHVPGGSSTGSALAVGLGLGPVAVGSDGGGSIRIPSAMNGLFGIKPSFIRVGRTGDIFANGSMSHIGPIGQSTEDLVDFLEVTGANPDPNDPISDWNPRTPRGDALVAQWRQALGRGIQGARIGILAEEWEDADPQVASVCRTALDALAADGAELVELSMPLSRHAPGTGVLVIAGETMGGLIDDYQQHANQMSQSLRLLLACLQRATAQEYFRACQTRARLRLEMAKQFHNVDLIAIPTINTPTPKWPLEQGSTPLADGPGTIAACRHNFLGNLTGLPAGSVPVGTIDNLPVGLQFIADAWDEASVFAAMAHCERMQMTTLPKPNGFFAWDALGVAP